MNKENFKLDDRITSTCFQIGDWPLSRVFLKDNAQFPWFVLVPRINDVQEIYELSKESRYQLIDEVSTLSSIMKTYFQPYKINLGYLGNIVKQLHIHIVGRSINDCLWPYGVWQASEENPTYEQKVVTYLLKDLKNEINGFFID